MGSSTSLLSFFAPAKNKQTFSGSFLFENYYLEVSYVLKAQREDRLKAKGSRRPDLHRQLWRTFSPSMLQTHAWTESCHQGEGDVGPEQECALGHCICRGPISHLAGLPHHFSRLPRPRFSKTCVHELGEIPGSTFSLESA